MPLCQTKNNEEKPAPSEIKTFMAPQNKRNGQEGDKAATTTTMGTTGVRHRFLHPHTHTHTHLREGNDNGVAYLQAPCLFED